MIFMYSSEYHHDYRAYSTKWRVNKTCTDVYEEKVDSRDGRKQGAASFPVTGPWRMVAMEIEVG